MQRKERRQEPPQEVPHWPQEEEEERNREEQERPTGPEPSRELLGQRPEEDTPLVLLELLLAVLVL